MINPTNEYLIQGVQYLQRFDNTFTPEDYKERNKYTFQLIEGALKEFTHFYSTGFLIEIIKMIVFDAIIGNTDRHQENWAIINQYVLEKLPGFNKEVSVLKYSRFAPIYDSGSSLGRELQESRIDELLASDNKLKLYVAKGSSEIHWNSKKISHFELIEQLLHTHYKGTIVDCIVSVQKLFNKTNLQEIVNHIDDKVPEKLTQYKIPDNRKRLIMKLITLRIEKLIELNEGI
jgi:hypothetical protein